MMSQIQLNIFCFSAAIIFLVTPLSAQEVSIVDQLKSIESGDIDEARSALRDLKSNYPDDPSVKFLDAVLSADGISALFKYDNLLADYPNSIYADAAVYRIFSYYYSIGSYSKAESYFARLKSDYPSSPYIRAANRSIPDEPDLVPVIVPAPVVQDTIESETEKYLYTVQAGAFLNITNAQNLSKKFESDNYYSNIFSKEVGGSILNVVVVGKFRTKQEAQSFINRLDKDYNLKGRIIQYNF